MHKASFLCLWRSHIVKILTVELSHPLTLKSPGIILDGDSRKDIRFFFTVLNIAAGLLNQEKRDWMPRGQMLSTHWKAMLISSEHMIMERRMVLSKHSVRDNSVDHEKAMRTHNWWEVSSSSSENIFKRFENKIAFWIFCSLWKGNIGSWIWLLVSICLLR